MDHEIDTFFIDGTWRPASSGRTIDVVSASTEQVVAHAPEGTEADVDAAVDAARRAFDDPQGWARWEPSARAEVMERLADGLDARGEEMARRVSTQNGMPIATSTLVEAALPQRLLRYYAALVREADPDEVRDGLAGGRTRVRRLPVGVVGAIVPWNFPQGLGAHKIAPALAAGCTVVVKPSPQTVLDAHLLAEAVQEAGFPPGVVNIVPAGGEVGAHLVAHPGVDKVAFTGSTAAGRSIATTCGRLLRPVTLELGGKSAAIVLDDADLGAHLEDFFAATLANNGQTCYLSTRVLVPAARHDEIVDTLAAFVGGLQVGDALDPATQIGPVVSSKHRDRVEGYIATGRAEGARVVAGGGRPRDLERGWFVQPTVFADVDPSATIAQEEIFGPVLSVIGYGDVDDAVRIANDSRYGLAGSVWTADPDRGEAVAACVKTGTIGINAYNPDPTAPFGGIKDSGLGRELGPEGLAQYQVLQSVYLAG